MLAVSRLPRLRDFDYRGRHSYFLTFCTYRRKSTFREASVASMVTGQILRSAKSFEFDVLAYCLMPDHVHLLVHGRSDRSDLQASIRQAS